MSGVFICYRRSRYVEHAAGRLHDTMVRVFGEDEVFMDVDSLRPGEDWEMAIDNALAGCDVLLAVIDPEWIEDKRLRDADDVLRGELERALSRNLWVVPVLINRAEAPRRKQLPKTLRPLARKQGHPIEHRSWRTDVEPLVEVVGEKLGTTPMLFSTADAAELLEAADSDRTSEAPAPAAAAGEARTRLSVYLTSSVGEFVAERDALEAALQSSNLPIHLWRFEDAAASSSPPRDIWRAAMERCDAVVALLGENLGQYVVDEIDVARALEKPLLVYAKDEHSEKVEDYLRHIADPQTGITARYFRDIADLSTSLTHDLAGYVVSEYRDVSMRRREPDHVRLLEPDLGHLVGRTTEAEMLLDLIEGGESLIVVHGPSGIGKKSLVGHVGATSHLQAAFPDGVPVNPQVNAEVADDLLQDLWETFYEPSDPTFVPTPRRRAKDLRHIEALVVLPDIPSERLAPLDRVFDAMPRSTFVVTTEDAQTLGQAIELSGLTDEAELIAVFEDRYGGEVPEDARAGILALCQAVDGHPGKIEQLAATAALDERRGVGDATDDFLTSWVAELPDLTSDESGARPGREPSAVDVVASIGTQVPLSVLADVASEENIEDVIIDTNELA